MKPAPAFTFLLALCGLAAATPAIAQTSLELRPSSYRVAAGQQIRVQLLSSGRPTAEPWPAAEWLFVRGEGTQENRDTPPLSDAAGLVALPAAGPGGAVVGIDFEPAITTIPAKTVRDFIASRGANAVALDPVKDALSVRHTRSCTALVRIVDAQGGGAGPSETIVGKLGQAAEIRMLMDPTVARIGSDVPLRVYVGGGKLSGARIFATARATGKTTELRTSEDGIAHLRITDAGPWVVEVHRVSKGTTTDLEIASAVLTFEVPSPRAGAGGAK